MPGRPAAAPPGDVGVDPEFWPARSGSASFALWLGPSAGLAVTAAGLTRGSRQLRQLGGAGLWRLYPRSRGRGLAPSLRSARARRAPVITRLLTGRIFAAFHSAAGLGLYRRAGSRPSRAESRRSGRTRRCLVIRDVGPSHPISAPHGFCNVAMGPPRFFFSCLNFSFAFEFQRY